MAALFVFLLVADNAHAQRASENVVTSAEDAFGTSVGEDSIGLYSSQAARGFSPKDAGNMRIEGLFYDQQGNFGFTNQLIQSTTIRVGLSSQSYPFPAPTGIADIRLRLPGDKTITSVSGHYGPYGSSYGGEVNLQSPIINGKLGGVLSATAANKELDFHSTFYHVDVAGLLHWTPNDNTEVISFAQRSYADNGESNSLIFSGGEFLPPKIDRTIYVGPDFFQGRNRTQMNFGLIGRSRISGNWRLQTGVFRSSNRLKNDFIPFFLNTQQDGTADLSVRANPTTQLRSYSGEVRASGVYAEGPRRHTLHFSGKGRLVRRTFGGDDTVNIGPAMIGELIPLPKPDFNLGERSLDKVRQGTLGATYVAQWRNVGEISAGIQKTFYRRNVDQPGLPLATSRNNPWLYNGTIAAYLTNDLTFYASYTRGLEESGIAPENASNPGEALPASITEQIDAGLRYKIGSKLTLVAGVFEVSKPYFDRDPTNLFTRVGSLTHRGIEVSLSGQPVDGLKVVAGALLLKARVSGTTVDSGLIGEVPPGLTPALFRVNLDYGPEAWRGFSVNARLNHEDSHYANRLNTFRISNATTLDLGMRYDFKIYDSSVSLRFDVDNVTNVYIWTSSGSSGRFSPLASRNFTARFVADF